MIDIQRIDAIIDRWGSDREFVIEMFQDIQDEFRHIPNEALVRVSDRTGAPRGELFHIATFYKAFSLEPRGEKKIQVCMGTACFVKGSRQILEALQRELRITSNQTTEDGKFTLVEVRCLGCCSIAPVITVGDDIVGEVRPSQVPEIIARFS